MQDRQDNRTPRQKKATQENWTLFMLGSIRGQLSALLENPNTHPSIDKADLEKALKLVDKAPAGDQPLSTPPPITDHSPKGRI